jgi:hypothetical protein
MATSLSDASSDTSTNESNPENQHGDGEDRRADVDQLNPIMCTRFEKLASLERGNVFDQDFAPIHVRQGSYVVLAVRRSWSCRLHKKWTFTNTIASSILDIRGEFFDQEEFQGRQIIVRYVWSEITANSAHFEQSFSPDGGKTWETNWIATDTRLKEGSAKAQ